MNLREEAKTDLAAPVPSFCFAGLIYALSGKGLYVIDPETSRVVRELTLFEKEGMARLIRANGRFIIISDFCSLTVLDKADLSVVSKLTLGTDLSSDVCGLAVSSTDVFACIRNGKVLRIPFSDFTPVPIGIGNDSSWFAVPVGDVLYAGTVGGELLEIKGDCVNRRVRVSRQNLRNLYYSDGTLYISSQDKNLYLADTETLSVRKAKAKLHGYMFDIAGMLDGKLLTVCHPGSEIRITDLQNGTEESFPVRLRLSGGSVILDRKLYLSSRSINGLSVMKIE